MIAINANQRNIASSGYLILTFLSLKHSPNLLSKVVEINENRHFI